MSSKLEKVKRPLGRWAITCVLGAVMSVPAWAQPQEDAKDAALPESTPSATSVAPTAPPVAASPVSEPATDLPVATLALPNFSPAARHASADGRWKATTTRATQNYVVSALTVNDADRVVAAGSGTLTFTVASASDIDFYYLTGAMTPQRSEADDLYYHWYCAGGGIQNYGTPADETESAGVLNANTIQWTVPANPGKYVIWVHVNDSGANKIPNPKIYPLKDWVTKRGRQAGTDRNDIGGVDKYIEVQVVEPRLVVEREVNGAWIEMTDPSREVWVGDRISLRASMSNGRPLRNYRWSVSGERFLYYIPNQPHNDISHPVAYVAQTGIISQNPVATIFRWKNRGSFAPTFSADCDGKAYTKSFAFVVKKPTCEMVADILCQTDWRENLLVFGDPARLTPGIRFKAKRTGTWPTNYEVQWVQIVTGSARRLHIYSPSDEWVKVVPKVVTQNPTYPWLDTFYPCGPPQDPETPIPSGDWHYYTSDPPQQPPTFVQGDTRYYGDEIRISENFAMFLMFRTTDTGSNWVPLRKITWLWGGRAKENGSWSVTYPKGTADPSVETTTLPEWEGNIADSTYKPFQPTNPTNRQTNRRENIGGDTLPASTPSVSRNAAHAQRKCDGSVKKRLTPKIPKSVKGGAVIHGVQMTAFMENLGNINQKGGLPLCIQIKNSGSRLVSVVDILAESDFEFTITDSQGKKVPFSKYGEMRNANRGIAFRAQYRRLKKGGAYTYSVDLSKLFILSAKGKYKVTVARDLYISGRRRVVLSNTVNFTVTERPEEKI